MSKYNIILINTHDTGRFISPYGCDAPTPHLMEFALNGITFRKCFSAAPTCSPSRAATLTGICPHKTGMQGLVNRGWQLFDNSRHLASFLSANGYETVLCGLQHEGKDWRNLGYTRSIGLDEHVEMDRVEWDIRNTERAVSYLSEDHERPFFLSVGFFGTHREYPESSGKINPDFLQVPAILPDCHEIRKDFADFYQSVSNVDTCFGRILNAIKARGREKDSIIIFTTDHGIAFPYMKCTLFDTGIGVSFIMDYPGNRLKGRACDALISQCDIFPTLCDLLEIEKPTWLEGVSFLPILNGEKKEVREEVFAEVTYHASYEPMRCIRTSRYKYIKLFYGNEPVPANIDDSPSKSFFVDNGMLDRKKETEMLFDLIYDPVERMNLAYKEEYQSIRESLDTALRMWMEKTEDPLLYSPIVPKPKGAQVNKPDCISPMLEDYIPAMDTDWQY